MTDRSVYDPKVFIANGWDNRVLISGGAGGFEILSGGAPYPHEYLLHNDTAAGGPYLLLTGTSGALLLTGVAGKLVLTEA